MIAFLSHKLRKRSRTATKPKTYGCFGVYFRTRTIWREKQHNIPIFDSQTPPLPRRSPGVFPRYCKGAHRLRAIGRACLETPRDKENAVRRIDRTAFASPMLKKARSARDQRSPAAYRRPIASRPSCDRSRRAGACAGGWTEASPRPARRLRCTQEPPPA